jgi:hypothetical protein
MPWSYSKDFWWNGNGRRDVPPTLESACIVGKTLNYSNLFCQGGPPSKVYRGQLAKQGNWIFVPHKHSTTFFVRISSGSKELVLYAEVVGYAPFEVSIQTIKSSTSCLSWAVLSSNQSWIYCWMWGMVTIASI